MKVVHVTSAHPCEDARILYKECVSLARDGYDVTLVCGDPPVCSQDVRIVSFKRPVKRFSRMTLGVCRAIIAATRLAPDVLHIHDPELLPAACIYRAFGHSVIYDVHEDLPRQILSKIWIPHWLRFGIARIADVVERYLASTMTARVLAEPSLVSRFPTCNTVVVQNFPLQGEFPDCKHYEPDSDFLAVYVGGITEIRGALEMVSAIALLPDEVTPRLILAGVSPLPELAVRMQSLPGWKRTEILGWQNRQEVAALLQKASVGLAVLHPEPNYVDSYPTKVFEYMLAGVPSIVSDFPLWRRIVADSGSGLVVDPLDSKQIAAAMMTFVNDAEKQRQFGQKARAVARKHYVWSTEFEKLSALYKAITKC